MQEKYSLYPDITLCGTYIRDGIFEFLKKLSFCSLNCNNYDTLFYKSVELYPKFRVNFLLRIYIPCLRLL